MSAFLSEAEIDRARLTPGLNGVLRAASKEFGLGANTNAKGEGVKYWAPHCLETHPGELIIPLQRTEKGTRFDIMTQAANAIYFNVPHLMPFLYPFFFSKTISRCPRLVFGGPRFVFGTTSLAKTSPRSSKTWRRRRSRPR